MQREKFLKEVEKTVCHDRNDQYGEPEDSFRLIADLWTTYLTSRTKIEVDVTSEDVALMMILLKIAREMSMQKEDNLTDIAGYAACASEIVRPPVPDFAKDLVTNE